MKNIDIKSPISGLMFMIVHCIFFSLLGVVTKMIEGRLSPIELTLILNVGGMILILPLAMYSGYKINSLGNKLHIIRGILCAFEEIPLFYSVELMPLTQVAAILLSYPIMATIFSMILLKEQVSLKRKITIFIGVIGALIIINPSSDFNLMGTMCALATASMWGFLDIIIKLACTDEKNPESFSSMIFSVSFWATITTIPIMLYKLFCTQQTYIDNVFDIDIIINLFLLVVMHLSALMAFYAAFASRGEVSLLSSLYFSTLIFTSIFAYFIFHESIEINTIIGSVVVIISSLYTAYNEYRQIKMAKRQVI